jgi:hypothetical protein
VLRHRHWHWHPRLDGDDEHYRRVCHVSACFLVAIEE